MAIDTANKRFSMMDFGRSPRVALPIADGSIDADDRLFLLGLYSGLTASPPPPAPPIEWPVITPPPVIEVPETPPIYQMEQMSVPAAFRQFLLTEIQGDDAREFYRRELIAVIADRIHYHVVPQLGTDENLCAGGVKPYVWFRQSDATRDRCLSGETRPIADVTTLDVEVWARDPGISEIAEHFLTMLCEGYGDGAQGSPFGGILVQDVLVESADDDYLPQGFVDDGLHEQSFQIEIYPYWS